MIKPGFSRFIGPGAVIGVLGSGQLGRMFAIAARRMGYRVHTLSPDEDTPTGQVADLEIQASYDDLDAVSDFARHVGVVTFEFEMFRRQLPRPQPAVRPFVPADRFFTLPSSASVRNRFSRAPVCRPRRIARCIRSLVCIARLRISVVRRC